MPRLPYLEDGDPGIANVVEVDGTLEGVVLPRGAVGVVLVPVHAGGIAWHRCTAAYSVIHIL